MMLFSVYCVAGFFGVYTSLVLSFSPRNWTHWLTGLFLAGAGLLLLLAATTPGLYYNAEDYFGDLWIAAEALNKASGGLVSSVDFFSPIGPAYYWTLALTADLSGQVSLATIMHASALAAIVMVALSFVMLRGLVSPTGLAAIVLSVVAIAVSGRGNGEILHEMHMHYLAPYNRWGWALFIPVMVRLSLHDRGTNALANIALGIAITLLLLIKVTYGAAALGMLAGRVVLFPKAWRQMVIAIATLVTALGSIELITGQVGAHLQDLATTAQLPESGIRLAKLFTQLGEMALYLVFACAVYLVSAHHGPDQPFSLRTIYTFSRPLLLIASVALASCAVLTQNHYSVEAATYPILLLIALEWTGAFHPSTLVEGWNGVRERVLLSLTLGFVLFYPIVDFGMHVGQRVQLALLDRDPAFAETAFFDLRFEPYNVVRPDSRLNTITDGRAGILTGLNTLRSAGAGQEDAGTVASLGFANPFPMLLGKASPSSTPIWLHEGRSFSRDVFVEADDFFVGVDFIIIPKGGGELLREIYADTLLNDFVHYNSDQFWTVMVRTK